MIAVAAAVIAVATAMIAAAMEIVAAVIAAVMTVDITVIVAAAFAMEAPISPAMVVAPIGPGTYAQEDAVVEVARAVVAVGGAGVRGIVIVTPLAGRRRATDVHADVGTADMDAEADLGAGRVGREGQTGH